MKWLVTKIGFLFQASTFEMDQALLERELGMSVKPYKRENFADLQARYYLFRF